MDFNFDEAWTNLDSSLVKGVWYNDTTRQMLVRLSGDKQYVYNNVHRTEAEDIAEADSPGSAYNYFRSHRATNQTGSHAHGLRPVARAPKPVAANQYLSYEQPSTGTGGGQTITLSGNTGEAFAVTYRLAEKEFTSTVKAQSLVLAAQDVHNKLVALGLDAKLTGVVAKS